MFKKQKRIDIGHHSAGIKKGIFLLITQVNIFNNNLPKQFNIHPFNRNISIRSFRNIFGNYCNDNILNNTALKNNIECSCCKQNHRYNNKNDIYGFFDNFALSV